MLSAPGAATKTQSGAAPLTDNPPSAVAQMLQKILRALPPALRRRTAVAAASDYFYSGWLRGALASLMLNTFAFSRAGQL